MDRAVKYLGVKAPPFIGPDELDTVEANPRLTNVTISGDELTALCPVTDGPDLYRIGISYTPGKVLLESKALKLYLNSFRNRGIFCEDLAAEIAGDLAHVLGVPVFVTLTQQPRGGLSIAATAEGEP